MITLYAFDGHLPDAAVGHSRDLRAQWALEETGLPYRVHGLDQPAGEVQGDAFTRISPFQQLPVIDDDGFILSESGAIVLYLAEKAGRLIPGDARGRAEVTRWCFAALTTLEPAVTAVNFIDFGFDGDPDGAPQRRARWAELAGRWLGGLQRRLSEVPHLAGEEFTVADILLTTVLRGTPGDLLEPHPALADYRRRCEARPAWARTLDDYERRLNLAPGTARPPAIGKRPAPDRT